MADPVRNTPKPIMSADSTDAPEREDSPEQISFCKDQVLPPLAVLVVVVAQFYLFSRLISYNQ